MINTDYLYNPQAADSLYEKILPEKNSGVKILKRATILPFKKNIDGYPQCWGYGGVLDGNGRFIDNSVLFTGLDCYPYSPPPTHGLFKLRNRHLSRHVSLGLGARHNRQPAPTVVPQE